MNLLFDTETSGKAEFNLTPDDLRQPHLVQLACILADDDAKIHAEVSLIIEPNGWMISEEVSLIHGISHIRAEASGVPRRIALSVFNMLVKKAKRVAAHNLDFDELVMRSQFSREKEHCRIRDVERICTMKIATPVCKIPSQFPKRGRDPYKWPTLTETHQFLFNKGFDGAHDALVDTRALYRVFFELVRLGHIKL